ncbi:MAG: glycerol-3-phosphate acyltransferase [Spirochaetaceae bacterium]|jgi:acyl-phosphate glycerol 3-phosphate acyltransferase|nr:glycerol-3-phosphate acyltransferase [Spirochaetaceae bacterium]
MSYLYAFIFILIGYISGSVNYAILITRAVKGLDIRTLGNKNPGTSNVMREVGKPWGVLVSVLDALKGLLPIILLRIFFYKGDSSFEISVLYLVGIAAVLGHCKSIFLKFKGGGGVGTMQGVFLFFIPVEYLFSMLLGGIIVLIFFKDAQYKFGQKTPIFFISLTPFVTLFTSYFLDIPLFTHFSIGGHLPVVVIYTFVMSLLLLLVNAKFLNRQIR